MFIYATQTPVYDQKYILSEHKPGDVIILSAGLSPFGLGDDTFVTESLCYTVGMGSLTNVGVY